MENIIIKVEETIVTSFINTQNELEYTVNKADDGGFFEIDNLNKMTKEELTDILISSLDIDNENIEIIN